MSKPLSVPDLLDLIRRSRVIDEPRLTGFVDRVRGAGVLVPTPDLMLDRLVADGLLTRFQAGQLAVGRWRGFTVGGYRVLDKLGTGGMSQVFLAEPLDRAAGAPDRVAVKVLDSRLVDDPVARARFTREAWAAAALTHPNIVTVLAVHSDDAPPHLVMEYVDGLTFQAAVARAGTFSAGTAAHCAAQAAAGLERACQAGLVHRDVKPANLIIDRSGAVKVLDLGIVRVPWAGDLTFRMDNKTVLGTADYLAPEQAVDSTAVDTRADVYALGGTLYFLLAGHPPFPDGRADQKLVLKQREDPPPIDKLRPDVPAGLAAVVGRMMARRPEDRYPTPAAAGAALAPWVDPDSGFPAALFATDRATTILDGAGLATPVSRPRDPDPADAEPTTTFAPASVQPSHPEPSPVLPSWMAPRWVWAGVAGALVAAAAAGYVVGRSGAGGPDPPATRAAG